MGRWWALVAALLLLWLGGALLALRWLVSAPVEPPAPPPSPAPVQGAARSISHEVVTLKKEARKRSKLSVESLEEEALHEVLREAAENPVEKGERPEWREHVGVGHKDSIFDRGLVGDSSNSLRQNLRGNSKPQVLKNSVPISSLISRSDSVSVTCDTRGNLGPCTVINQIIPGKDWLKDRWQAASDMGGTAIPGHHWVVMDFHEKFYFDKIVLDWEAAYSNAYRIEGSNSFDTNYESMKWTVLFDGTLPQKQQMEGQQTTIESGQSPGVKYKMPLHIVHTVHLQGFLQEQGAFQYMRVYVTHPARGWGVSLWQVDVYGRAEAFGKQ